MRRIAVLLTCFNRREKTLKALENIYRAFALTTDLVNLTIYLTDDGSSDGTSDAVKQNYPEVKVLQGNGQLYWAGGMRNSWRAALKDHFDGYLLLNDDTDVFENVFSELLNTHDFCVENYKIPGIYIGSTINPKTQKLSYGGSIFTNRFLAKSIKLIPNQKIPQECELGNANIMLVHRVVVQKLGILSEKFIHGLADFDYTLMATKNGIPVLITPNYLGQCINDNVNPYVNFHNLKFRDRIKTLYNPIGLDFKSNLQYMKRNFPLRLPLVFLAGWFKVLFPKIYRLRHK